MNRARWIVFGVVFAAVFAGFVFAKWSVDFAAWTQGERATLFFTALVGAAYASAYPGLGEGKR